MTKKHVVKPRPRRKERERERDHLRVNHSLHGRRRHPARFYYFSCSFSGLFHAFYFFSHFVFRWLRAGGGGRRENSLPGGGGGGGGGGRETKTRLNKEYVALMIVVIDGELRVLVATPLSYEPVSVRPFCGCVFFWAAPTLTVTRWAERGAQRQFSVVFVFFGQKPSNRPPISYLFP